MIAFIETTDKKDENPIYKNEKLYKSVMEDITIGMYINYNNHTYKPLPVEFEDVRGHVEMPRNLCQSSAPPEIMIRSIWTSFNNLSAMIYTPLIPVGGIVQFDLYKFHDLFPNDLKTWTVRQIYEMQQTLTPIVYPDQKGIGTLLF